MSFKIAVIDGMGGGIGSEIISAIRKELPSDITIIALGANAVATDRMIQAKANQGATGTNAIRVSINMADYIIGPMGIVLPNGLMGEITAEIAEIIISGRGKKLLLPVHQSHVSIMGLEKKPIKELIDVTIATIKMEKFLDKA